MLLSLMLQQLIPSDALARNASLPSRLPVRLRLCIGLQRNVATFMSAYIELLFVEEFGVSKGPGALRKGDPGQTTSVWGTPDALAWTTTA